MLETTRHITSTRIKKCFQCHKAFSRDPIFLSRNWLICKLPKPFSIKQNSNRGFWISPGSNKSNQLKNHKLHKKAVKRHWKSSLKLMNYKRSVKNTFLKSAIMKTLILLFRVTACTAYSLFFVSFSLFSSTSNSASRKSVTKLRQLFSRASFHAIDLENWD